jgi:hypothetical protein
MSVLLARRRILAAKIESTVGTAETLAAADAALNVFDPKMSPDISNEERQGQGSFSPLASALGAYGGQISFQTELHGGAADPFWAATLLPACGMVGSAHVYTPHSEGPGTNVKTLTIGLYQDGVLKILRGCAGNAVFKFVAGKPVRIEWTFKGVWSAPTDVALLAPTYPTTSPLRFVSSSLAIGAWSPKAAELTLDLGNDVVLREDAANASGYISAVITGRKMKGTLNPEASLVATKDVYGDWLARTEAALALTLGPTGNHVAFAAPKLQWTKADDDDRNGIAINPLEFQLNRSASAGDDELSITIG